jgi:hypothetical protein
VTAASWALGIALAIPACALVLLLDTRHERTAAYALAAYVGCTPLPIAVAFAHDAGGGWWYAPAALAGLAAWVFCGTWLAWVLTPISRGWRH